MVHIYCIEFRNLGMIYIGSSFNPEKRFNHHMLAYGVHERRIGICKEHSEWHIIDTVKSSERLYWERFYMELFKSWGFKLKNKQRILNTDNRVFGGLPKRKIKR